MKDSGMSDLTVENIAHIRQEYFKLDDEMRRKIMVVAEHLAEEDEQTLHASVWYFSQKKNKKELDTVFNDIMNNSLAFNDATEGKSKAIPSSIRIVKKK